LGESYHGDLGFTQLGKDLLDGMTEMWQLGLLLIRPSLTGWTPF